MRNIRGKLKMRIYEPLNKATAIHKGVFNSEFENHAELYALLKKDGFDTSGNVGLFQTRGLSRRLVFDLVVYGPNRKALAIIEVKRKDDGPRVHLDQTLQGAKYRQFGVPVILFWDLGYYEQLKEFLQNTKSNVEKEDSNDLFSKEKQNAEVVSLLRSLVKRLDAASMAAYDVKRTLSRDSDLAQLETTLENLRDKVKALHGKI